MVAGSQRDEDPRVVRSRELVLDAGATVFVERGYAAATMDDVASAAGLARRTLFNLYGGKEALFRAVMGRSIATAEEFSAAIAREVAAVSDPVVELEDLGARLALTVLGGQVVRLRRLLLQEAGRFPDLVVEYWERAPGAVLEALTRLFERQMESGRLRTSDPRLAAEHFAYLVMGASLDRAMFVEVMPPGQVRRRAGAGVEAFLRSHAPS